MESRACRVENHTGEGSKFNRATGIRRYALFGLVIGTIAVGMLSMPALQDKIFLFGPAVIIIIVIAFHSFILVPKPFSPVPVHRFSRRPTNFHRISSILLERDIQEAGIVMYNTYRRMICLRLDIPLDSSDAAIIEATAECINNGAPDVCIRDFLDAYRMISCGREKIANEKEFLRHFKNLNDLISMVPDCAERVQAGISSVSGL